MPYVVQAQGHIYMLHFAKISLNLITQCNFKPIKNELYSFKLKTTVTNKPFGTGAVLKLAD